MSALNFGQQKPNLELPGPVTTLIVAVTSISLRISGVASCENEYLYSC